VEVGEETRGWAGGEKTVKMEAERRDERGKSRESAKYRGQRRMNRVTARATTQENEKKEKKAKKQKTPKSATRVLRSSLPLARARPHSQL
jgi:hypothetical protein